MVYLLGAPGTVRATCCPSAGCSSMGRSGMATAEVSPPVADHAEDQLSRDLADLRVRAKHAAAQLADIHARLAVLEEQIRLHQQRQ